MGFIELSNRVKLYNAYREARSHFNRFGLDSHEEAVRIINSDVHKKNMDALTNFGVDLHAL